MWSSVVLFVLTFAVFGLLLGFASVYDTNQGAQTGESAAVRQNASGNATQAGPPTNPDTNQESGQ